MDSFNSVSEHAYESKRDKVRFLEFRLSTVPTNDPPWPTLLLATSGLPLLQLTPRLSHVFFHSLWKQELITIHGRSFWWVQVRGQITLKIPHPTPSKWKFGKRNNGPPPHSQEMFNPKHVGKAAQLSDLQYQLPTWWKFYRVQLHNLAASCKIRIASRKSGLWTSRSVPIPELSKVPGDGKNSSKVRAFNKDGSTRNKGNHPMIVEDISVYSVFQ